MLECKKCGNKDWFYVKVKVTGTINIIYNSVGEVDGGGMNTDMYNSLNYYDGKCVYCLDCDKRIGFKKDLIEE